MSSASPRRGFSGVNPQASRPDVEAQQKISSIRVSGQITNALLPECHYRTVPAQAWHTSEHDLKTGMGNSLESKGRELRGEDLNLRPLGYEPKI